MSVATDLSTTVGSVAAIVSAYQDANELLRDVQERRRATVSQDGLQADERPSQDLELSMARGQDVIRSQYERDFKRLGGLFATGDQIARDTLKDIVLHMQKQVVSPLKLAWQSNNPVDFLSLQDVSDDSQDRAIMCLMQLHQRLLVAAPISLIGGVPTRPINPSAGKPQGFIDDPPAAVAIDAAARLDPRRRHSKSNFGYHVEVSAPPLTKKEPLLKSVFMPGFHKRQQESRDVRDQNMHGIGRSYRAPHDQAYNRYYDGRRREHYYEQDQGHRYEDSISSEGSGAYNEARYEHQRPSATRATDQSEQYADSPTVLPEVRPRQPSVVDSVSSFGMESEHPEYNPWAEGDAVSPLSVMADEIAASNPYHDPLVPKGLVPNALEPRRSKFRDSQMTLHSRVTSATLPVPVEVTSKHYSDEYEDQHVENIHRPWINDRDSLESRESGAPYFNYYNSQIPNDPARYDNTPTSPIEEESEAERWAHQVRRQTRSPPNPSYTWMPPMPPQRILELEAPSAMQSASPPRPAPPMEHERPFPRSHSVRSPYTPRSVPLHEGPPPSAPPDRPIPVPTPRIPARAANRPRGLSNTSGSNTSNHSPIASMTPPTPATPRSEHAPMPYIPPPVQKVVPLARHNTTTSNFSNSASSGVTALSSPPLRVIPPLTSGTVKAYLPSEANKYAGFCKGAWRLQIGDTKKTWEERNRPAGMYAKMSTYYKCQKCHFEGRATKEPGAKKSSIDTKVYGSKGILYRWEFLFKSHLPVEKANTSTLNSHFGCMFCVAAGKGTPVFLGLAALLAHLQEHREVLPEGEIVYRMHAIVGRSPSPEEDFHIALPSLQL